MRLAHKYSYEKPSFDGADSLGLGDLALYGVLCAVFCYGAGYGLLRLAVFEIIRLGADVKIRCVKCSRVIMIPRVELNKKIKKVITEAIE